MGEKVVLNWNRLGRIRLRQRQNLCQTIAKTKPTQNQNSLQERQEPSRIKITRQRNSEQARKRTR